MSATGTAVPAERRPYRGLAITSLVLGILSIPSFGCFGVGAIAGLVLGIMAVVKAERHPGEYAGKGMAYAGIVASGLGLLLFPIGLLSAISIPALLHARASANESAAIGDVRTVISAEAAYQAANGGFYEGRLQCLHRPTVGCIPDYPASAPTFLDAPLVSIEPKSGYRRQLYPGTAPSPSELTAGVPVSPTSVKSYAYVAVPVKPGNTGTRGFCGDSTGVVCATRDSRPPEVRDGACQLGSCEALQ